LSFVRHIYNRVSTLVSLSVWNFHLS
jgi:hypothetical protein